MHSTSVASGGVPAFLVKLWKLVEDNNYDDLICWNANGTSFFIHDQPRFSRELLPLYFKHNNMASFIRQLNMYGFRKVVNIESGGLRVEKDEMEFQHKFFRKGNAKLLELIKRKVATGKSLPQEETKPQPDLINSMMFEVKNLHGKQESFNSKLETMKRENETLWREIAALRQQHMKQQQIIQKLIQFFISIVQPNRGMGVGMKRKMPLMLNSSPHSESKCSRLSRTLSFESGSGSGANAQDIASSSSATRSGTGPVIHDITDCVDAHNFMCTGSDLALMLPSKEEVSPSPASEPIVNSPGPNIGTDNTEDGRSSNAVAESLQATGVTDAVTDVISSSPTKSANLDEFFKEISNNFPVMQSPSAETTSEPTIPTANSLDKTLSKVDIVDHIDSVNLEFEALKDMFLNGDVTVDASTLMGLFSTDDSLSFKSLSDMGEFGKFPISNEIVGNELTQFNAGTFGLDEPDTITYIQDDVIGEPEGLFLDQGAIYDPASEGIVDENDQETSVGTIPLSTDLVFTPDLDLLMESPNLLTEDNTMLPGRRKENAPDS